MFSGIKFEREHAKPKQAEPADGGPVRVLIAAARPFLHSRTPPLPPIPFPTISLHSDRHKIITALSSSGTEMEVTQLPEFTRNAIATKIDEDERPPDVLFFCGSGTSWDDEKLIAEDGFGSADFISIEDMKLVVPERPKVIFAVGGFCDAFADTVVELGVSCACISLDTRDSPGAVDSYEYICLLFKALARNDENKTIVQVAKDTVRLLESKGRATSYIKVAAALRAVAPPAPMPVSIGSCRVLDPDGMAALRARQSPRVFRCLDFDGRSEFMWQVLSATERSCTHSMVILHGPSGCGRTETAAQLMLWFLDRSKLSAGVWGSCDWQSDIAHTVTDQDSLLQLAGGLMLLGIAGRNGDLRAEVLLRALKASRAMLVIDDWHRLNPAAEQELSALLKKVPVNIRVIITVKGTADSEAVQRVAGLFPKALNLRVPDIASGIAQRMLFVHMERCKHGEQHLAPLHFQNRFHRAGQCTQLGDLDQEEMHLLQRLCGDGLGELGQAHALSLLILGACCAEASISEIFRRYQEHQATDYGFPGMVAFGADGWVEQNVLWPALCVAYHFLTDRHRDMAVLLMHVGMPLSPDELAVMTDETPNSATSVLSVLLAFRLCTRTPAGLYSITPAVRDAINAHLARRSTLDSTVQTFFNLDDFNAEPWVAPLCRVSALEAHRHAVKYFGALGGAWAEVACARHMLLLLGGMGVDQDPNAAAGSLTMLYSVYARLVLRWFHEWERGGVQPPGGFEACLDGRHAPCRPLPEHYLALRDLLSQVAQLAAEKERQRAASEVLANLLFAVGDYANARKVLQWHSIITEEEQKQARK